MYTTFLILLHQQWLLPRCSHGQKQTWLRNPTVYRIFVKVSHELALVFSFLFLCLPGLAQSPPTSGTTLFVLDGNRIYAELSFIRPDGSIHKALAFVDMGSPTTTIKESLFKEPQLEKQMPLVFRVGSMVVQVSAAEVVNEPGEPHLLVRR